MMRWRREDKVEASYYHFGVIVKDLAEAIPRFSMMFGRDFGEPLEFPMDAFADPVPRAATVNASFSKGGAPYVELIKGHDDKGFFRIDLGERLHHIGRWEDDVEGRVKELEAAGFEREASITANGTLAVWFGSPATLHGTRIELVTSASRDWLVDLIESAPTYRG
jgi:hypothetical protein